MGIEKEESHSSHFMSLEFENNIVSILHLPESNERLPRGLTIRIFHCCTCKSSEARALNQHQYVLKCTFEIWVTNLWSNASSEASSPG